VAFGRYECLAVPFTRRTERVTTSAWRHAKRTRRKQSVTINSGIGNEDLPRITIVHKQPYTLFGRLLLCVYDSASVAYLPFFDACQEFGLDGLAQLAFARQHHILNEGLCLSQFEGTDVTLLRLDALALWLSMLPKREVAQTTIVAELITLQVTAAFVLQEALATGYLTNLLLADGLMGEDDPALLIYRQALQLFQLARENLRLNMIIPD
jgi:hypothetical protein